MKISLMIHKVSKSFPWLFNYSLNINNLVFFKANLNAAESFWILRQFFLWYFGQDICDSTISNRPSFVPSDFSSSRHHFAKLEPIKVSILKNHKINSPKLSLCICLYQESKWCRLDENDDGTNDGVLLIVLLQMFWPTEP